MSTDRTVSPSETKARRLTSTTPVSMPTSTRIALAVTFRGIQAERLWASAGAGVVYGCSADGLQSGIEEAKQFLE